MKTRKNRFSLCSLTGSAKLKSREPTSFQHQHTSLDNENNLANVYHLSAAEMLNLNVTIKVFTIMYFANCNNMFNLDIYFMHSLVCLYKYDSLRSRMSYRYLARYKMDLRRTFSRVIQTDVELFEAHHSPWILTGNHSGICSDPWLHTETKCSCSQHENKHFWYEMRGIRSEKESTKESGWRSERSSYNVHGIFPRWDCRKIFGRCSNPSSPSLEAVS